MLNLLQVLINANVYTKGVFFIRKVFGLMAFIATGGGLILSTAINEDSLYKTEILMIIGVFFVISLIDHYKNLKLDESKKKIDKWSFYFLICSLIGVSLTWYINHKMGYGPVIANGLVGVMAAIFLTNDLAGITYTSSFIGMSSLAIIPTITTAILASFILWFVFLFTGEIYSGIGGKGGTTAALSTIVTIIIMNFFS